MYKMTILEKKSKLIIKNKEFLMQEASLHYNNGFEAIGLQDDGTPVVFDKCGNFGYLDAKKVSIIIEFENIIAHAADRKKVGG